MACHHATELMTLGHLLRQHACVQAFHKAATPNGNHQVGSRIQRIAMRYLDRWGLQGSGSSFEVSGLLGFCKIPICDFMRPQISWHDRPCDLVGVLAVFLVQMQGAAARRARSALALRAARQYVRCPEEGLHTKSPSVR